MSNNITQLHNISPDEFKAEILEGIKKSLEEFGKSFHPVEEDVWITRKEIKEMLSISYPTIHDWCNKKILKPYKIGRQVRFKKSEVIAVLENSNSKALK
jgi:excisionase family DNA binding protein